MRKLGRMYIKERFRIEENFVTERTISELLYFIMYRCFP